MAIRPAFKTAFLGEVAEASDASDLESIVADMPDEYQAEAELAQAIADRRAEFAGPAGALTDSELIEQVIARDAVRAQFNLDAEGNPVAPAAEAQDEAEDAPLFEVTDAGLVAGAYTLAVDDSLTIDATAISFEGAALVAADDLATLRANAVTDERLDALRAVAQTLGAADTAEMAFDAVVAFIADNQEALAAAEGTEPAAAEAATDEPEPALDMLGLGGVADLYQGADSFYLDLRA